MTQIVHVIGTSSLKDPKKQCGSPDAKPIVQRDARTEVQSAEHKRPEEHKAGEPTFCGVSMKWLSLIALTVQTSGQALLIKWSKSQSAGEQPYLNTTVVFFTEMTKMFASFALVVLETGSVGAAVDCLTNHFSQSRLDLLKAAVPSLIYVLQNNLMFYSLSKLSAPVQQVAYQMKVVTTAAIGVIMLGKSLTNTQWVSCFLLAFGVALVQWPRESGDTTLGSDEVKGFIAVLCACCTSGFAGVWIQKMLQQTKASVWVRNVQLGLFGSIVSFATVAVVDGDRALEGGLLQGYNRRVVSVICMTAFGGLLCALMLKYAGATHGCFSTALSIILTSLLSQCLLGDFRTDVLFGAGATIAVVASVLFSVGWPAWITSGAGKQRTPASSPTPSAAEVRSSDMCRGSESPLRHRSPKAPPQG
mmetsp:Transcript_99845/g.286810  ORF Transcript_99845/g.286810 Transcript_99845/m.286810 type:complete len:417 (-) Transcript_99845:150-1400(-)